MCVKMFIGVIAKQAIVVTTKMIPRVNIIVIVIIIVAYYYCWNSSCSVGWVVVAAIKLVHILVTSNSIRRFMIGVRPISFSVMDDMRCYFMAIN